VPCFSSPTMFAPRCPGGIEVLKHQEQRPAPRSSLQYPFSAPPQSLCASWNSVLLRSGKLREVEKVSLFHNRPPTWSAWRFSTNPQGACAARAKVALPYLVVVFVFPHPAPTEPIGMAQRISRGHREQKSDLLSGVAPGVSRRPCPVPVLKRFEQPCPSASQPHVIIKPGYRSVSGRPTSF
jgi:hypothetical protein